MIRPIATVFTGTLGSRLLGFIRDAMLAALFGATAVADAFLLAFQVINVARRLVSEGSLNAAFVPAYLRIRNSTGDIAAAAFAGRALGAIGTALIGASAILALLMPQVVALLAPGFGDSATLQIAVESARLMLPYLAFAGPVAVLAAALNANGQVVFTSFSPLLFNIAMIAVIAVLLTMDGMRATTSALVLGATVGIAGCMQAAVLVFAGARTAWPLRLSFAPEIRALLGRALPGMIAQSGPQLLLVAGALVASASPAAISWLYFASRLVELPLGIVGAAAGTVLLPALSHATHNDDSAGHDTAASLALQLGLGLALPAAIGLATLAQPIVALLYERGAFSASDTAATALTLAVLATALPAHTLIKTFNASFFAREQMLTPALTTVVGLAATLVIALLVHTRFGYAGIAVAMAAGAWLTVLTLGGLLAGARALPIDRAGASKLARIVLASALMGTAIVAARAAMSDADASLLSRAVTLATLIALGLLVYAAALRLFGVVSFRIVRKAFGQAG
ncbi:membrane protein [Afipia sp. P52-10]|uniref:murein biosynthesis integral membrane protein MurJ n=1 Tax=Afipia sp. P52-10 TaxID=1429916 RepID=UPI0003DF1702|nr:murein biosynthesis integral membrane protein MurJ [Afipia sp. P52-10]ETR78001.1 membrane protein [Afipia sp. P52-10]